MTFARIAGTGGYLPERIVTNTELEKLVDTSDEWIRERSGIERRHIAADNETSSDMAVAAARAITQPEILSRTRAEWEERTRDNPYVSPIPDDVKPPRILAPR